MTVACVIPARYNSSRFPGKLLVRAAGKTILQRTFERASDCPDIDELYVATDDERIANHVQSLGGQVIWTSPECKNGTERIIEALRSHSRLQQASIIVNLQGDHPCTEPGTIGAIIQKLKSDKEAVMSTAVTAIKNIEDFQSPHIVKAVFDREGNALYFSRSPIPYSRDPSSLGYAHIGIYCFRRTFLLSDLGAELTPLQKSEDLEQLKILELGHRIKIAIVDEIPMGVDTPQDLVKLEKYLCLLSTSS